MDDTGSQAGGGAFCAESGVNAEVEDLYGYSIRIEKPLTPTQGGALFADLVAIFQALAVVDNNSPAAPGGGGAGRQPPPPPICGADAAAEHAAPPVTVRVFDNSARAGAPVAGQHVRHA